MLFKKNKTLLLAALLSSFSSQSLAEDLSTVVVSATRSEQSSLTTASNIIVINRQQIEQSAATSVAELLRRYSGVVVSDTFGDGSRASIGVRGFGETASSNTLILVDGRRLNNPDIGSPDLYSVSIVDIERIEVVYGSAGVLYGDQAVGGVINIITRSSTHASKELELLQGSYAKAEARLRMSGGLSDDVSYKLLLDRRSTDNYRDHNENSYQQAYGLVSYNYDNGNAFFEWQYADDELETPGAIFANDLVTDRQQVLAGNETDFSNLKTNTARAGIKHDVNQDWGIEAEFTSRRADGTFDLGFGASAQDREVYELTPRAIGVFEMNNSEAIVTVGIDLLESEYLLSSAFGEQFNDQTMRSFYAQIVMPATEKLDLTVGSRYAEVKNELKDSGFFAIYPTGQDADDDLTVIELGAKYQLSDQLSLSARIEENYRFAKVDEYMQPAFSGFSPVILETQTGVSYELGADWSNHSVWLNASVFLLDLENEIIYDPLNFANINIDSTTRKGINLNSRYTVNDETGLGMNLALQRADVETGIFAGKEVPYVPEEQLNMYVDYQVTDSVGLLLEAEYTSERVMSSDFPNVLQKMPSYTLFNLVSSFKDRNVVFRFRINNLFDKQYSEYALSGFNPTSFQFEESYYPSPERNYTLSANIKF